MDDLIERLEKLDGPSREIDDEIAEWVGTSEPRMGGPNPDGTQWADDWHAPLPYTRSVDAALTLVPDGWRWNTGSQNVGDEYDGPVSYCWKPNPKVHVQTARAVNPALALCIAALKARASALVPV